MASLGTLLPAGASTSSGALSSATSTGSTGSTSQNSSAISTDSSSALANQNTFLQLLVAQLQHQDPTQPVDGTTFVTQLATFSDLQANLGSKTDLDAISKQLLGSVPSGTSDAGTSSTGTSGGSTASGSGTTSGTTSGSSVTGS